jgi:hypothetical protein
VESVDSALDEDADVAVDDFAGTFFSIPFLAAFFVRGGRDSGGEVVVFAFFVAAFLGLGGGSSIFSLPLLRFGAWADA